MTFVWLLRLKEQLGEAAQDRHRNELKQKAVHVALICAMSLKVDDEHLCRILSSHEDASTLLQCSIVIQECHHTIENTSDAPVPVLIYRSRQLLHRVHPILLEQLAHAKPRSLEDAIQKSESAYRTGQHWQHCQEQEDHWLLTDIPSVEERDSVRVHYNLLSGELLVNGSPLANLPTEYEQCSAYRTLFSYSAMEVMPTVLPGMRFSTKKKYAGYTLHFGISHSTLYHDLLLRAEDENESLELVPNRLLQSEFPTSLRGLFTSTTPPTAKFNSDQLRLPGLEQAGFSARKSQEKVGA